MSWFKKATQLVQLPLDSIKHNTTIDEQVQYIADQAADYYYNKNKGNEPLGVFHCIDPYIIRWNKENPDLEQKEIEKEFSVILRTIPNGYAAAYSPNINYNSEKDPPSMQGILTVCPSNVSADDLLTAFWGKKEFANVLKKYIKHELTHVIDPKFQIGNPFKGIEKNIQLNELRKNEKRTKQLDYLDYLYYSSPIEFDGHCREIIEQLKHDAKTNPRILDKVSDWAKGKTAKIPDELRFAKYRITQWVIHDDENQKLKNKGARYDRHEYIPIFKMRIYNELLKNLNPMVESQEDIERRKLIQHKLQLLNNSQRKATRMSWFTKISRRPWSEIPFTDREVRPNTNPYSTKNEDYPEKSNITTIDSPGMGTNQHNNSEVSGDGESDSKVKDLTSFTDIDSIMYEGQVMDEDTGGKPRPRTTDTGGPYIGDQPMVLGLPDDAAGSFVVNYSPNEKTPQEVATDSFLNFQNRPSRRVQLNGRTVNIV